MWNNQKGGKNQIDCQLDRFLVSKSLLKKHNFLEPSILPSAGFDH